MQYNSRKHNGIVPVWEMVFHDDEDAEAIKKLREEVASVKQASEEAKASASEASAKAASAAAESEALAKLRGDVMAVKEGSEKLHSEQTKTNQEQSKINEAVHRAVDGNKSFGIHLTVHEHV